VNQGALARTLDAVVEDCVNAVGVDLNTASVPLLKRVSGLSAAVAASIVRWRDAHGGFRSRQQLLEVSGLGPKTFEQAAGFLRIRDGDNPLDMTGVHPETYPVVQKMLAITGRPVHELMGRAEVLRTLKPELIAREMAQEVGEEGRNTRFGAITVRDIVAELEKPGRDPRPDFKVARLDEAIADITDLKPGLVLEGTVSNVAQFGAFVDLGVHQDGLVHVSQLANKFVRDAREVVKAGQVVKVRVLEVDLARRRIALSMRLDGEAARAGAVDGRGAAGDNRFRPARPGERGPRPGAGVGAGAGRNEPAAEGAMAAAFAKLRGAR
jgi:uncharacterized protein